jgi:hypothetical protein
LGPVLSLARSAGDRYTEKFALERLGTVYAARGNLPVALRLLSDALAIARTLGDRKHEADLLWHVAIRQAESDQREHASNSAESAIQLLESMGNTEARVYREHLQKYRQSEAASSLHQYAEAANGVIVTTMMGNPPSPATASPVNRQGPGGGFRRQFAHPLRRLRNEDRFRRNSTRTIAKVRRMPIPHGHALPDLRLFHQP